MNKPHVSIIIRTLNEQLYLADLLDSINRQTFSLPFEVILIDSGSSDNTLSIATDYGCRILHISRDEFSFGRSLNRACEAAFGSFLVFISGHCIPYDHLWLHSLIEPLHSGNVQYSYGRQIGGPLTYWSESMIFSKYFPCNSSIPQKGFFCNNANSAILSSVWESYRFDETLTGLEDMELAKRLVSNGGLVGYCANACVYHLHHENWQQVKRRFEREALALKFIYPEVILRRRDVIRYFCSGVLRDIIEVFPAHFSFKVLIQIIRYRFSQFSGSYSGNHSHKVSSNSLRDLYFYPTSSKP